MGKKHKSKIKRKLCNKSRNDFEKTFKIIFGREMNLNDYLVYNTGFNSGYKAKKKDIK